MNTIENEIVKFKLSEFIYKFNNLNEQLMIINYLFDTNKIYMKSDSNILSGIIVISDNKAEIVNSKFLNFMTKTVFRGF